MEGTISSVKKKSAKPKEILGSRPSKPKSLDERYIDLSEQYIELLKLREEVSKLHKLQN